MPTQKNILIGNFLPKSQSFEDTGLFDQIINRLPSVEVVELEPQSLGNSIFGLFRDKFDDLVKFLRNSDNFNANLIAKNLGKEFGAEDSRFIGNVTNVKAPEKYTGHSGTFKIDKNSGRTKIDKIPPLSITMFFKMFSSNVKNSYIFPISSSPDISIMTSAGWQPASKSVLKILTDMTKSSKFTTGEGEDKRITILGSFGKITNLIGSSLQFLGKDLQIGPYFKVTELMKNKPTFTFNTYLLNDSQKSAKQNKDIIERLMIGSLPAATGGLDFRPGSLFNISVGLGLGENDSLKNLTPMKQLYLCTANIEIINHGIYRDKITPELYEIKFTFNSLLPDYINLQMLDFNNHGTKFLDYKYDKDKDINDPKPDILTTMPANLPPGEERAELHKKQQERITELNNSLNEIKNKIDSYNNDNIELLRQGKEDEYLMGLKNLEKQEDLLRDELEKLNKVRGDKLHFKNGGQK